MGLIIQLFVNYSALLGAAFSEGSNAKDAELMQ
jgi:hypothetical protein